MMDHQDVGQQAQNADQQTPTVSSQPVNAATPPTVSYGQPQAAYSPYGQQPYAQPPYQQPYYMPVVMMPPGYGPVPRQSNGTGTAGFVLALLGLLFSWIPILDFILWLLGLILSFAGLFNKPRGLAIAGMVLSLLGAIVIIFLIGSLGLFAFLR